MIYSLNQAEACERHELPYFEVLGNRAVYYKGCRRTASSAALWPGSRGSGRRHPSWPPGGHAIEISGRRGHPATDPGEQAERSGPDLLCARELSAACAFVEVAEKLTKTRIGVSQLPPDVAQGPPPELAPDHHDVREGAGLSVGVAIIETSRAVASRTALRSL
jgi:hypothetical protein